MGQIKNIAMKKVVVVLPYISNKVLMQLRDFNSEIIFPGSWAFFGGSLEKGETAEEAAKRELSEEIGYNATDLYKLGIEPDLGHLLIHAFCCELKIPIEKLVLREGLDFAFFTLEEIMRGDLYSHKFKKCFPVADSPYILNTIKKMAEEVFNK